MVTREKSYPRPGGCGYGGGMTDYVDYDPYDIDELRFHDRCLISRYRNLSWTLLDLTQQVVNGLIIAVREQDAPRERRLSALLTRAMWVHDLVERRLSRLIGAEDNRRWREKRDARRAGTGDAANTAKEAATSGGETDGEMPAPATQGPSLAGPTTFNDLPAAIGGGARKTAAQTDDQGPRTPEPEARCPREDTTTGRGGHAQTEAALEAMLQSVMTSLDQTEPGATTRAACAPP